MFRHKSEKYRFAQCEQFLKRKHFFMQATTKHQWELVTDHLRILDFWTSNGLCHVIGAIEMHQ